MPTARPARRFRLASRASCAVARSQRSGKRLLRVLSDDPTLFPLPIRENASRAAHSRGRMMRINCNRECMVETRATPLADTFANAYAVGRLYNAVLPSSSHCRTPSAIPFSPIG